MGLKSVLHTYLPDNINDDRPGTINMDFVVGCDINGIDAEGVIAELGNWQSVEISNDGGVWVAGPGRDHWLTWRDIEHLDKLLREQGGE